MKPPRVSTSVYTRVQNLIAASSCFGRGKFSSAAAAVDAMAVTRSRQSQGSGFLGMRTSPEDRKSTRLNSSHVKISYAVFCLKKKTHGREQRHKVHHRDLVQRRLIGRS